MAPDEETKPPLGNDFVFVDPGQFPRAWSGSGGSKFKKYERFSSDWTFGCESYLDHPLVAGQENRSPAKVIVDRSVGCEGTDEVRDPSSRRFLDRVVQSPGRICFHYDYLYFEGGTNLLATEDVVVQQTICFGYDGDQDQLLLSYAKNGGPAQELRYARYREESEQS